MKKTSILIAIMLAMCMTFAFAGCGGSDSGSSDSGGSDADSASSEETASSEESEASVCAYNCEGVGFGFDLPEGVEITKGYLYTHDMGDLNYNSGVMTGWPVYAAISEEDYKSMTSEEAAKLVAGFSFHVVCVKDVKTADEAREKLISVMEKVGGGELSKEEKDLYLGTEEVHTENGYMWLVDRPKTKTEGIPEEFQEEYNAFFDATDEIIENMKFYTPQVWQGGEEGADVVFETKDLNDMPVDSKSLFAKNKVTMINIWATTCGPCIKEMPELEKMNKEYSERGGAVVGLVADVPLDNNLYLEDARAIVTDTGVTYTNLRAWDGFNDVLSSVGTPTTYFVDSQGKLIGNPILGANLNGYKEYMERYLSEAK